MELDKNIDKHFSEKSGFESFDISKEQKIYELSLIWKEAEYNFAFWDKFDKSFDWDKEYRIALERVLNTNNLYDYYLELMRFISLLKDGHTDVWFPEKITESIEFYSRLPIEIDLIDDKYVITNMDKSLFNTISRYSVIKKINGIDIEEYIDKYIYPYIWHEKRDSAAWQTISFLIHGKEGSCEELLLNDGRNNYCVQLCRRSIKYERAYNNVLLNSEETNELFCSETHSIKFTKDNIAIITINSMMNDKLPCEIFKNYEMLNKAKGYIIDIRQNGGGSSYYSDCVASLFIGKSFKNSNTYHPIHIGVYKAWGKYNNIDKLSLFDFERKYKNNDSFDFFEKTYKICHHTLFEENMDEVTIDDTPGKLSGPVAILSSRNTASAAENFINVMRHNANAIIIGSASYGSTGQPLTYSLDSGGGFRICTRKSKALDDSEFINIGFKPDIECSLTIDDYKKCIDSVMVNALEYMRTKY